MKLNSFLWLSSSWNSQISPLSRLHYIIWKMDVGNKKHMSITKTEALDTYSPVTALNKTTQDHQEWIEDRRQQRINCITNVLHSSTHFMVPLKLVRKKKHNKKKVFFAANISLHLNLIDFNEYSFSHFNKSKLLYNF